MTTLDTLPSHSSAAPLLQAHGSGFPPQPIEAVWLSHAEAAIALSDRWAIVPGQAVRVMGPISSETGEPEWHAVAQVGSIQPYLDGQRVTLQPCWGTLAANAAWLEGLTSPIEFLLHQHPEVRPLQLLGQPLGAAYPLQGQGWKLTGTCVAGKQALLKELLASFTTGWILNASGWYGSTVWVHSENTPNIELTPGQRFEMAQHLCQALKTVLSSEEQTALMQASTLNEPSLLAFLHTLQQAVPSLPSIPQVALQGSYWDFSAMPSCWHTAIGALWQQQVLKQPPPVVVLVWPEAILENPPILIHQLREQGCCVVWVPLGTPAEPTTTKNPKAQWHTLQADIAWPLEAMESDALGQALSTEALPFDVAFCATGPTTWHLPVTWRLPGSVLPSGPIEWQAYGVQHRLPVTLPSQLNPTTLPPLSYPTKDSPEACESEFIESSTEPTLYLQNDEPVTPLEESYSFPSIELPAGLMAELGPLPDLSDLSSFESPMAEALQPTVEGLDQAPARVFTKTTTEAPIIEPTPSKPLPTATEEADGTKTVFLEEQSVYHPKYGRGTVVQIIPTGNRHTLQVAFDHAGTRLLDATQSGLQPA
ncbi:MAG: hypothetical protein QE263_03035 [Vampirovibrionales bacterium]|nr:hypothetical protein [Vampirovibrionales bacterium]